MPVRLWIFPLLFLALACDKDPRQVRFETPELAFETYFDGNLYVPLGWRSTVWAESPMLYNPSNIDIDARGRIWVAEAVNYRDYNNPPDQFAHLAKGDRILILEDTDHDGRADSSKVFVQDEDLVAPLGIAVMGNKVVVSCSPNLIVYTDTDGDDRPDHKEVLLSGFGGFDHDHSLHAVVGGPDGKWYFNTGNAGPHTVTDRSGWTLRSGSLYTGGSPYNRENQGNRRSDDGEVWVGGLALRVDPDGRGLEVLAHNFRNAYELTIDAYGDLWQNDNDDQVETCRVSWIMPRGNAGYFSADGSSFWLADRRPGQSLFTAHWHQEDPGVMPAGDNTGAGSPTGVLVYEGDTFGPAYRGMLLSVDAGRNVVFAYQPRAEGAGFSLQRHELISSVGTSTEGYVWNDLPDDERKYFRPSDIAAGPDGALYIADWYDPVVGGHQMRDTAAYGRIYRVAPEGHSPRPPRFDLSVAAEAAAALQSPAIHQRYLAFQALREGGPDRLSAVSDLLESENPRTRARAVWLLAQMGEEGRQAVERVLAEAAHPRLRVAAYRALLDQYPQDQPALADRAAGDPSPLVRREVATSLRQLPDSSAMAIAERLLASFDGKDRWYLEALGTGLEGRESIFYRRLRSKQPAQASRWDSAFARLAWRLHPPEAIPDFTERALDTLLGFSWRKEALTALGFIPTAGAAGAMKHLAADATDPRVRRLANWWLDFRGTNQWLAFLEKDTPSDSDLPPVSTERPIREGAAISLEDVLQASPEKTRGETLFQRNCGSCHRIDGHGKDIGPRLKHIRTKMDRRSLAEAIVYPNAAVTFGFEPIQIELQDGLVYQGFLLSEGEVVVIKDLNGNRRAFPKASIKRQSVMDYSLMPAASTLGLDAQGVADIAGYLLSLR